MQYESAKAVDPVSYMLTDLDDVQPLKGCKLILSFAASCACGYYDSTPLALLFYGNKVYVLNAEGVQS